MFIDTFFSVGKNWKKKKNPRNTTFVIISLKYWNNQWNSRKKLFIVIIALHAWDSKIKS